jgi:hypothetical protein
MTATIDFALHDVSDFPLVRISGRGLPAGYATQWAAEMDRLLARGEPFALVFLDNTEHDSHDDQKLRTLWLKQNKTRLAKLCRGIVGIEPDRAKRLVKRAQGAALAMAFGLTMKIVATRAEAETVARRLLAGETAAVPDDA